MAMDEYGTMIMASRGITLPDLRDVPLARITEHAEAKRVVETVMAGTAGPSLVVVSSFSSAL
jgi:hypothetical protein